MKTIFDILFYPFYLILALLVILMITIVFIVVFITSLFLALVNPYYIIKSCEKFSEGLKTVDNNNETK